MSRLILPRRALLKAGAAALITSPAIVGKAMAQLGGGFMFPGPGTAHSAGGGGGPVFDAAGGTHTIVSGTSITWTHTPVGTPTGVAVAVYSRDLAGTGTATATYGGVNMTETVRKGDTSLVGGFVYIFGLASPLSGPQTVVVTLSSSASGAVATSMSVTGGNTTTAFSNTGVSGAPVSSTSTTVTTTSATGELVFDMAAVEQGTATMTITGPQTAVMLNGTQGNITASAGRSPGAATVTPTYSLSATAAWLAVAASFKP